MTSEFARKRILNQEMFCFALSFSEQRITAQKMERVKEGEWEGEGRKRLQTNPCRLKTPTCTLRCHAVIDCPKLTNKIFGVPQWM